MPVGRGLDCYGPDLKTFPLDDLVRNFLCLFLVSTAGFRLLQYSNGVVLHPRALLMSKHVVLLSPRPYFCLIVFSIKPRLPFSIPLCVLSFQRQSSLCLFICDLCVARNDSWMTLKTSTRIEQIYATIKA